MRYRTALTNTQKDQIEMAETLLEMRDITKTFPGVMALQNV